MADRGRPHSLRSDIRHTLRKQFSRPMTGHTPRKLPPFDAISRIIAVHAQFSPTRAQIIYQVLPLLSREFSLFCKNFFVFFCAGSTKFQRRKGRGKPDLSDCQKSLAEFFRRSEKINSIVFCGGMYVAENTSHGEKCRIVRLWRTPEAWSEVQSLLSKKARPSSTS